MQVPLVRQLDGLDDGLVAELTAEHAFDDYRRYRRIAAHDALAYFRERLASLAALDSSTAWVAFDPVDARPQGCLVLQHLEHDSDLLGMPMAGVPVALVRSACEDRRAVYASLLAALLRQPGPAGHAHVSARIDTSDLAGYQAFTDAGFRLMETLVSLTYDSERRGRRPIDPADFGFDGSVRPVEARDLDALSALARRSFRLNRYHLDRQIPAELAREFMARWARSYCEDPVDHQVWVAEGPGGELAGFVGHCLNRDLERHVGLCMSGRALLAVANSRSHVGEMLSRFHLWRSRGDYMDADSQLNNYGMLKICFKMDMDMVRTRYTFHLHRG